MKIKLIHMPRVHIGYGHKQIPLVPLGIATLKSFLEKQGYKIDIDDLNIKVDYDTKYSKDRDQKGINLMLFENRERIRNYLKRGNDPEIEEEAEKILKKTNYKGYDIIGMSLQDELIFSVIGVSLVTAKLIKEQTGATIVLGGLTYPRPRVEHQKILNTGYVDYIVEGKGEYTFLNLCRGLEKGNLNKLDINELLSKGNKGPKTSKPLDSQKKNIFYRPNFDGLPLDLYKYKPTGKTKELSSKKVEVLMLPYIFVNGCPNNCIFCPIPIGKYSAQNPEIVAEDLKYLSKRYNTKNFFFLNSNVNPTYKYANQLTKEFERANLDILWNDSANFKQLDMKLAKKLRGIGAIKLIYGLECPSDRILKYIRKGITVKKAEKILKISHEAGIWNEIDLIAGMPYERDTDIQASINFLERNKKYLDYVHVGKFVMKNSFMLQNPKKYKLSNISNNITNIYNLKDFTRKFDETEGLKWEQKSKQILNSYQKIFQKSRNILKDRNLQYSSIHMPLLFYLYTVLNSKQEVIENFNQSYRDYIKDIPKNNNSKIEKFYQKGDITDCQDKRDIDPLIMEKIKRLSEWSKGKKQYPVMAELYLTQKCNLQCVYCWQRTPQEETKEIETSEWVRIIKQLSEAKIKRVMLTGGEPLCKKNRELILKEIKKQGIEGHLVTNGTLIDEKLAKLFVKIKWDSISISLDSSKEKTNDKLRGKSFKQIIKTIRLLNKLKTSKFEKPFLSINTTLTKENYKQLPELVELVKELGLTYISILPLVVYNKKSEKLLINKWRNKSLQKYLKKAHNLAEEYGIQTSIKDVMEKELTQKSHEMDSLLEQPSNKNKGFNPICFHPFSLLTIKEDGTVSPCPISGLKGEKFDKNKDLNDVWFGKSFTEFRERLLAHNIPSCCAICCIPKVLETKYLEEKLKEFLEDERPNKNEFHKG